MRQIVLDTETTGLEPAQGHRIIEIGCVELVNRRPTGRTFHSYLNPQRAMDVVQKSAFLQFEITDKSGALARVNQPVAVLEQEFVAETLSGPLELNHGMY